MPILCPHLNKGTHLTRVPFRKPCHLSLVSDTDGADSGALCLTHTSSPGLEDRHLRDLARLFVTSGSLLDRAIVADPPNPPLWGTPIAILG